MSDASIPHCSKCDEPQYSCDEGLNALIADAN